MTAQRQQEEAGRRATHEPERTEQPGLGPIPRPPEGDYEWVYLWHWPIRAMHWVAAVAIVALVVTGFYIGAPYFMTTGEPANQYLMGWMRFVHFAAAGLLVATGIVRAYWLFVGNKFESWRALFPFRREDWANMWKIVKHYMLIGEEEPEYMGHNPVQQISYTGLYAVTVVMVLTGFAMYGQSNPDGFFYATFSWVNGLLGGVQYTRFVHHVLTWVFLIFIPIHVYLTIRAEITESTGTVSSMVSGGRFLPRGEEFVDEE